MRVPTSLHDPAFRQAVEEIAARYPERRSALLPMLHLAQAVEGYVSQEAMRLAAAWLQLPPAQVASVVSFYTMYRRAPGGRVTISVCRSLSCALSGGDDIVRQLEQLLDVKAGGTTADGRFSLETVECLAACDQAPCALVHEQIHGPLNGGQLPAWLDTLHPDDSQTQEVG